MWYCNDYYEVLKPRQILMCQYSTFIAAINLAFCFCTGWLKIARLWSFGSAKCAALGSIRLTIATYDLFFFAFVSVQICFAFAGCANRTCQEYCVMWVQRRMASGVNIPPDVAQTVKTCFWTEDTNFLDRFWLCAALCHPTWNMTWLDKKKKKKRKRGGGTEILGKTRRSSGEQTDSISRPLGCTHWTPNRKGIRGRGQQLVPSTETIHNTCFAREWTLDWMDVLSVFIPHRE